MSANSRINAAAVQASQDRGPIVLTITIVLSIASTVFVALRLVSRIGVVKKVTWDDHFIVLVWLLAFGFSFSICWGVHAGLGHHETEIQPGNESALRKAEYAFSVIYNPVLMATKTSILIFYLTLSENHRVFRFLSWATLIVVNIAGIALTILNIVQCQPVSAVFKSPIPQGAVCTNIVTLFISSAPVNIITDLAILFLPMPILTGMRLPRKQKIILIITFSFGAFVAIVDVVRIAYLQNAFQVRLTELDQTSTRTRNREEGDFSWYASLSFMWSAIEVHVGIMCACVPSLKPLAHRFLPSILRDTSNPSDTSGLHYGETATVRRNLTARDHSSSLPNSETHSSPPDPANPEDGEMDIVDFLTTPTTPSRPTHDGAEAQEARNNALTCSPTATSWLSRAPSLTFFDFVNMNNPKSMTRLNNVESLFPLGLVTILFFLWGFAYGLLDVLNHQFQLVIHMSGAQEQGLHAAYFVGYLVGSLSYGVFVLKKWGFKASFVVGLCVYACGTLIFWPSAVLTSFPAFLACNFIVGMGLSTLEVAANPFIALCGPPEHAETRLNVSQGIQAIGSILSPLLAKKVLFEGVQDAPSLISAQWAYLGIALFDVALALVFYYLPIPEASDEELDDLASKRHMINERKVGGVQIIWITLGWGALSQFCYVGGQEVVAEDFLKYINIVNPNSAIGAFDYQTIGHTVFALGRFMCAFAGWFIKPRLILLTLYTGLIVTSILAMNTEGNTATAMIILILLFESGIFPMIYAISLRGLGSHSKTGASLLTAAVSGGALFPVVSSPVAKVRGLPYSFSVVVAISAFGALFPLYLMLFPPAMKQVDPVIKREGRRRTSLLPTEGMATRGKRHRIRDSRIIKTVTRRKKGMSTIQADRPTVEHVEGDGKEGWLG